MGAVAVVLFGASGCSEDASGAQPSLRERLSAGPMIALAAEPPGATMTSTVSSGSAPAVYDYELDVAGSIVLRADGTGNVTLEGLELDIEDLVITEMALPPDGLTLTNIRAEPSGAISGAGSWAADGSSVEVIATGQLLVDWAFIDSAGDTIQLSQLAIDDVDFAASAVLRSSGVIDVSIEATHAADFFDWAGFVTLSDLHIATRGTDP
jgi:hypothetical protein